MEKLKVFSAYATALAVACLSLGTAAAGQGKSVESVVEANNNKLAAPWITIKPGQSDNSGFALSRDGALSYAGNAFQPRIEVSDDKGRPSTRPSSVAISPLSHSGRFALLTACEPAASPSNLCWFQYLVDIPNRKLHQAAWAKYPTPAYVWWGKEDAFAVIPISDEGETWLSAFDLNTRDSRDIHFYEAVLAAARPLQCKPGEDDFAIDLNSLNWVGKNEVSLSVAVKCGSKTQVLSATVRLDKGTIKLGPAGAQQASSAASPSFDCGKASSTVEKTICADPSLAQLDSQLMALYQQAMKQTDDGNALKSQQLNWLRQVRNPCTSTSCLTSAYQRRIAELQRGGGATVPSWSPSPFPATYSGGGHRQGEAHVYRRRPPPRRGRSRGPLSSRPGFVLARRQIPSVARPAGQGQNRESPLQDPAGYA